MRISCQVSPCCQNLKEHFSSWTATLLTIASSIANEHAASIFATLVAPWKDLSSCSNGSKASMSAHYFFISLCSLSFWGRSPSHITWMDRCYLKWAETSEPSHNLECFSQAGKSQSTNESQMAIKVHISSAHQPGVNSLFFFPTWTEEGLAKWSWRQQTWQATATVCLYCLTHKNLAVFCSEQQTKRSLHFPPEVSLIKAVCIIWFIW